MLDSTFFIVNDEDMAAVERRILQLCNSSHGRCALFRSTDYARLRLAALYKTEYSGKLYQATYGPVRVQLQDKTIHIHFYSPINHEYDASVSENDDDENLNPSQHGTHRKRGKSSTGRRQSD